MARRTRSGGEQALSIMRIPQGIGVMDSDVEVLTEESVFIAKATAKGRKSSAVTGSLSTDRGSIGWEPIRISSGWELGRCTCGLGRAKFHRGWGGFPVEGGGLNSEYSPAPRMAIMNRIARVMVGYVGVTSTLPRRRSSRKSAHGSVRPSSLRVKSIGCKEGPQAMHAWTSGLSAGSFMVVSGAGVTGKRWSIKVTITLIALM